MGITQKINMVPMYIAMGLSQGIMPLISVNHKRKKDTIYFAAKVTICFIVVVEKVYYLGVGHVHGK